MSVGEKPKELIEIEEQAKKGGGEDAVQRQHKMGKLTARERVDLFFDQGSFVELGLFAQHECYDFGMEERRPYGDGVITGYGRVNGRIVYLYAQDFTVFGGTVGVAHARKVCNIMKLARKTKAPIIGFIDSSGARIQEGMRGTYSMLFAENIDTSGVVPQLSAIMGNCAGGGVYSPALTDFTFMVDGTSQMFIAGPQVIKAVNGENISMQDLGGAKVQSKTAGNCDFVAGDEEECLKAIKKLLSFLPQSCMEKPPVTMNTEDSPNRCDESLTEIIPENPKLAFDMYSIIKTIVDDGDFFEIKADFAKNLITGFSRLGGYPVGIVANRPNVLAGALDCDASDKGARFYRTCDCFNIPIISFTDVPGYLPGAAEEHKGIIRHGAKMLYAYREATVPKINCIIRKAYGGALFAMGSKTMGADLVFSWPFAEIAVMGAEGAVNVLYSREIESADDKEGFRKMKTEEYRRRFGTPYWSASVQAVDAVILPSETRPNLIRGLQMLWNKTEEQKPRRKHGNIPL
ncbi:carboxyl transferase domain protein [delta proteobacterium NaphS2]|nr:carboxyl transferase domain protein [delta proteobacterium NaphS2]